MEIAEIEAKNVEIEGSFFIEAEDVMGNGKPHMFNEDAGKCRLENVKIENRGIDRTAHNTYWKNKISRKEVCHIVIKGNGEFVAKDVTIKGNQKIEVPAGFRVTAFDDKGKLGLRKEKIDKPSWCWEYSFDEQDNIKLRIESN